MNEKIAHQLAIDTRLKLGLQSMEYFDVYRAISSLGISCIRRPLESNVSGATFCTDNVKMVLVNSAKSLGHQNFTIAHELYHCLYDKGITHRACRVENFSKASKSEQVAEFFAVHLLIPEDGIYHQLQLRGKLDTKLMLVDIVNLEQFFGVSRKAMRWRLEELNLISRQESDKFSRNVIRSARLLGKKTALYERTMDIFTISDYAEKAHEALEKGLITESRYEELLSDAGLLEIVKGKGEEADVTD